MDDIENRTIIGLRNVTLNLVELATTHPFEILTRINRNYKKENPLLPMTVDCVRSIVVFLRSCGRREKLVHPLHVHAIDVTN